MADTLLHELSDAQLAVFAASATEPILTAVHAGRLPPGLLCVDLGAPRNVAPDAAAAGVRIVDLEDLKHWHRRVGCDHAELLGIARRKVDDHQEKYDVFARNIKGWNPR